MRGFAILLGFNLLGVLMQHLWNVPLPGNVIGLILFVVALSLGWVRLEWVEQTSQFLLQHMMLFFAPFIVGVVGVTVWLKQEWLAVSAGIVLSTILAIILTGFVTQKMLNEPADAEVGTDKACG